MQASPAARARRAARTAPLPLGSTGPRHADRAGSTHVSSTSGTKNIWSRGGNRAEAGAAPRRDTGTGSTGSASAGSTHAHVPPVPAGSAAATGITAGTTAPSTEPAPWAGGCEELPKRRQRSGYRRGPRHCAQSTTRVHAHGHTNTHVHVRVGYMRVLKHTKANTYPGRTHGAHTRVHTCTGTDRHEPAKHLATAQFRPAQLNPSSAQFSPAQSQFSSVQPSSAQLSSNPVQPSSGQLNPSSAQCSSAQLRPAQSQFSSVQFNSAQPSSAHFSPP